MLANIENVDDHASAIASALLQQLEDGVLFSIERNEFASSTQSGKDEADRDSSMCLYRALGGRLPLVRRATVLPSLMTHSQSVDERRHLRLLRPDPGRLCRSRCCPVWRPEPCMHVEMLIKTAREREANSWNSHNLVVFSSCRCQQSIEKVRRKVLRGCEHR